MPILERLLEIIIPVFMIVSVGYFYARRYRPDMGMFNRIALEVCTPMLTYSALASRTFEIERYLPLLAGGALLIFGAGLLAWPLALLARQSPRTLVPVVMFNNCGNMGLPLALLAFGPANFGAADLVAACELAEHAAAQLRLPEVQSAAARVPQEFELVRMALLEACLRA